MMYGMMGGVIWVSLVFVVLLFGAAYVIWVLAAKEQGNVKTVGQVIAVTIAVLAAIILLYGVVYGGVMGRGCLGGYDRGSMMMGGPRMMKYMDRMPEKERHELMEEMMDKYMKK